MPKSIPIEDVLAKLDADPEYRALRERNAVASAVSVWLVRYRADHDLSQRALAALVGMSQPQIARLEMGDREPKVSTLLRLSKALGLPIDLRGGTSEGVPVTVGAA